MPEPQNKNKLVIYRGIYRGSEVEFSNSDVFTVCFNPTEYTVSKRTSYAEAAIPGLDSPILQFNKGEARTLSIELLVDTQTYGNGGDVREEYLKKLQDFLMVQSDLHAPPPCQVVWGTLHFVGVLEDMKKRYVMFLENGKPVRARVTLSFKEYVPVSVQLRNTPRNSPDRRKVHLLKSGDTLWRLAYEAYGDPRYWRIIADENDIDTPREPGVGRPIVIPPLKRRIGMFAHGD